MQRKKLGGINYLLIRRHDYGNKKEIEIELDGQTLPEKKLMAILRREFGGSDGRSLFFHTERTMLVVGEIDWEAEAKKEERV